MPTNAPPFSTPLMQQYWQVKQQYADCLVFFRMGDFYELFLEDAEIGAEVLKITLTSRPEGRDGRVPMAGVPHHAVDNYLAKLVQAGHKVAICEQLTPPNSKGIIKREVVRVVTPGTQLDESALENKSHNYIVAINLNDHYVALTAADLSTGDFITQQLEITNLDQQIIDLLNRWQPTECLLPPNLYENSEIITLLKSLPYLNIYQFNDWNKYRSQSKAILTKHFQLQTLDSLGLVDCPLAIETAAVLLTYLQQTQHSSVAHLNRLKLANQTDYLTLDRSTVINLELFTTIRDHTAQGSLLYSLDQTITAMGGRLLKDWLIQPLTNASQIKQRHQAVAELKVDNHFLNDLRLRFKSINDIERALSRLSVGLGNARDLVNLKVSLHQILELKNLLANSQSTLIKHLDQQISPKLQKIINLIDTTILDEPAINTKEGNLIKPQINTQLDELRKTINTSQDWLIQLETSERQKTGISSLKIRFNQVFGFYIEVSKSNLSSVPDHYHRQQTLVNAERFITPELKHHEQIILGAEQQINQLEFEIYQQTLSEVLKQTRLIQQAALSVAILDCIANFATLAIERHYVQPEIVNDNSIQINAGRHPVVEQLIGQTNFVPNQLQLGGNQPQIMLLTGPNMAGKSVYIRQIALITLMNQIGCFVPAADAKLPIVDRIFVRSGASDVITSNLSTFMVEMVETANILHQSSPNSLIILDEIGRGTSTYDGLSIAWSVIEHLINHFQPSPLTLFATHYHELQDLESQFPESIINYQMSVDNSSGQPVFLHSLVAGGASHSFGVAVARLAGLPKSVIDRADQLLAELEQKTTAVTTQNQTDLTQQEIADQLIRREILNLDLHRCTPIEALNKLAELKDKLQFAQTTPVKVN